MLRCTIVARSLHNLSRSCLAVKVICIIVYLMIFTHFSFHHIFFQQNNYAVKNFSQLTASQVNLFDNNNRYSNNVVLRYQSTEVASSGSSSVLEKIPEPPAIPDVEAAAPVQGIIEKVVESTSAIVEGAEPAFSSIGLGGWTPAGMVQNCMEFLHISCDIPWWGTILIGTICVRVILFPLVVMAQRNGAKLANNMPQLQILQAKMTEARQMGNAIDSARYSQAMMQFMKEKQVNPLKNMIVPLAQAPLFISFFVGLRQMANAPVESMKEGGLFWFTDLTVPDQFYLLPIITSLTMLATIEVGTDSARLEHQNMQVMNKLNLIKIFKI